MSTETNAQCESYELSFIWGKMRTAFQIAPIKCSEEAGGKVRIYVILLKEWYMQLGPCPFAEGFC